MSKFKWKKDEDPSGLGDSFWVSYHTLIAKHEGPVVASNSPVVAKVLRWFEQLGLPKPSLPEVHALANSPLTQTDPIQTFQLVRYYQLSKEGRFLTNERHDKLGHSITYAGAENWESVMCYMDALLFAMFTNLDSFEPILFISNQFHNPLVNRLSNLLRVYVNLLRSGYLIKTDLTIKICETLLKLGYTAAMSHRQQDSADLFEFLTEIMSMPLLTFKIDIKHAGKFNEEDDRKYSRERILFVSIPENIDSDEDILLEECLEHYFNNSINVKRELERRATLENMLIPEDSGISELTDMTMESHSTEKVPPRIEVRTRSSTLSIWTVSDNDLATKPKEVSLPAWMFLRLLPFYTDDNNVSISKNGNISSVAKNSKEFANRRPVLPICLKRYNYSNQQANRLLQKVIIPPVISLPQFVADDDDDTASGNYKLILESAICHRGTSISSGHFVAVVRHNFCNINETDDEAYNARWYLYDDMKKKDKVVLKTFKEIFTTEWPYMLFYRLIAIDDTTTGGSVGSDASSVAQSPKVIVPQGSKGTFWKEETPLSPILSVSNSPSMKSATTVETSAKSTSDKMSKTNTEIPPTDPRYIDIKDKYYWYVPDSDKNYYKEYPSLSRNNTREPSLTPQFRRNSQWSDHSTPMTAEEKPNSISIGELLRAMTKLLVEKFNTNNSNHSTSSLWNKSKNFFSSPKLLDSPLSRTISPIDLNTHEEAVIYGDRPSGVSPLPDTEGHHHHHHLFHRDELHRKYKKARKKRDDYQKDKCIIS